MMSASGGNQTTGVLPITDDPEVLPVNVPAMTKENEDPASTAVGTAENETGTCVPRSSAPVTLGNAADTRLASAVQSVTSQNDFFERFAQIPQEQMTEFFRALANMTARTAVPGGTLPSTLPASSATGSVATNTPVKPSSCQPTACTEQDNNLDDSDNILTRRSRRDADRSRQDVNANSDLEEFEDAIDPIPRFGRQLTRRTMQKNEYAWVLSGQILPVAAITEVAPPSHNPLMYTAYIMNNLARTGPDENMLWSILRSGGGVCSPSYTLYDVALTFVRSSTSLVS